jgi:hypothetical protein
MLQAATCASFLLLTSHQSTPLLAHRDFKDKRVVSALKCCEQAGQAAHLRAEGLHSALHMQPLAASTRRS